MANKKKFAFSEIDHYREYLEIKSLRGKNKITSVVFFALLILTVVYAILAGYSFSEIVPLAIGYLLLLIANFVLSAYGELNTSYTVINKYISTLGMFSITTAMIIYFQSPSIIPLLFISYSVCAIYQDIMVIIISDFYFLFTIVMIATFYPDMLVFSEGGGVHVSITLFSILFLMLLSISAYIIMKEKTFFHNQISKSKEIEFRNLDLLLKLKKETGKDDSNILSYYDRTNEFLQSFSDKLDIPNIFEDKIQIMKLLEQNVSVENIIKEYPDNTKADILRLEKLLISKKSVLSKIAMKIYSTNNIDIKKREIFSATHFKSFNKPNESIDIKIIAFVIFYAALKKGVIGLDNLSDDEIFKTLTESDWYYNIDPKVMKIYQDNPEVFDAIIADAFGKGGRSK